MRAPNRLDSFYHELNELHKEFCPDTRFGQLMIGFSYWIKAVKDHDGFYTEEDEMLEFLREYLSEISQSSRRGKST